MPDGAARASRSAVVGGYDIEQQVGFLLRQAHQRHTALFGAMMASVELTPTQFNALVRVVELGSVTQNHLGRLTAMDPATVQGVVGRLNERGLVESRSDPEDRRAKVLRATVAGAALASKAIEVGRSVTEATLAPLGEDERVEFLRLLRKVS